MKKNLPISLLVLFTVFAVLSGNTSYQNLSLHHRSYCIQETEKKKSSLVIAGVTKYPGLVQQASGTTIELVKNKNSDMIVGSYKKGDDMIVSQAGWAGIVLVRLYFEFTKFSGKKLAKYHTISVSQKTGG